MYRLIVALLFALVIAVFAIQNATLVDIQFLAWTLSGISLVLVILGSSAAGAIVVAVLGLFKQFKWSRRIREQQERIKRLEADLKEKASEGTRLKEQVDLLQQALESRGAGEDTPETTA